MPFIPHTQNDVDAMLETLDIDSIATLYDEVPSSLPAADIDAIPQGMTELEVTRLMEERAPPVFSGSCFIGAGAYEHYSPSAVWDIVGRGEFYTAYTPYQAEASQGNLQLIYEYQTIMTQLTDMDVSNASLYDGASSLAEAALMAIRIKRRRAQRVVVPATINPIYRKVLTSILLPQGVVIEELPYCAVTGTIVVDALAKINTEGLAAIILPQPNFFGCLEQVDALTDAAHELGALVIGLVNPMALSLLKPPGQWGANGADIVCGEGQPMGIPLASGGPYFGLLCCKKQFVRQMPGRIVGRTLDLDGNVGYTLTLQAREQHIRRAKATSNICTNQGLMVTASTIFMSLMGARGLRDVAAKCHDNARYLKERLISVAGVKAVFDTPYFHEFVLRIDKPIDELLTQLTDFGIQGGYSLATEYPELHDCILVCATETKTQQDLERYQQLLARCLV
ncbi:MAG: aminomethyl-transferring glycine dehydrogenase [Coxiella sp. (in: Bacteria)]|nr:MAG: aminomethyl-transferring glycine dehydrogenase [Coxiella sp. (in: g-proteobacteria)]